MQYTQKIEINDSEFIALMDAIHIYKEFVSKKIGDKIKAPYWSRLQSINTVEYKLKSK
jgi:hypothetical protein